ncbi:MAG: hypothetical protein J4G05_12395 [Chlorobi bacterium]|nr:hypothetical protein [Chlorobiota bacterium]
MKMSLLFLSLLLLSFPVVQAEETTVVKRDNGSAGGVHNFPGREASVILQPEGPCKVLEIQIYFASNTPASDTIWVVGDPAEGAVPPTGWVWSYNTIVLPFVISYDGLPGWKSYDVSEMNIRSDGYDRRTRTIRSPGSASRCLTQSLGYRRRCRSLSGCRISHIRYPASGN